MYMENLFILGYVGTCRIWTVLGLQIRKGCQDFVHEVGPHQVILSRLVSEIFNLNIPNFNLRLFQARAAPVTPAKPVEMRPLAAAGNILPRNANGIRTHLTCELCGYEPTAKNK